MTWVRCSSCGEEYQYSDAPERLAHVCKSGYDGMLDAEEFRKWKEDKKKKESRLELMDGDNDTIAFERDHGSVTIIFYRTKAHENCVLLNGNQVKTLIKFLQGSLDGVQT